jgi:hypothetical protein
MALYPGARQRLITPGSNDPAITPIGVILHVDAGNSASLYNYFSTASGGIESHFHIPKTGSPEQYRDTSREADANYKGNSFLKNGKRYGFISVETQGLGSGEWNAHQLDEIKKLLLWANKVHGIPLRRCPDWDEAGIGYHVMFGAPGPWTPVSKSCPGPDRVKQFNNILVPWFRNATTPPPPPPVTSKDLIDMATQAEIAAAVEAGIRDYMRDFFKNDSGTGDAMWDGTRIHRDRVEAHNREMEAKMDRLVTAVEGLVAILGKPNA